MSNVQLVRIHHHADEHTFWTLSLTGLTNATQVCKVVADKLSIDAKLVLCLYYGSKEIELKPTDCPTDIIAKYEKKSKKPVKVVVKPALPGTVLPSKPSNQLTKAQSLDTGTLDKNKVVRIFLGDDTEMHTFWTLSLTTTTTVRSLCDLLAEKLTLPPGSFRLFISISDTELLIGEEELILPYKLKKDSEGKPYSLLVRSTKQEDIGVNFSRTGTLKRSVFVEPTPAPTPAAQPTTSPAPPTPQQTATAELQIFPIPLTANQVVIPSSISEQLKQIYISLQKVGSLPPANNDWDMLVNLYNSTVAVCLEISLKLLINLTAEESNQVVICNDEGIIKRAISIFQSSEVKLKEVVAWFIANLSVNPNNMDRLSNLNLVTMLLSVIQPTNGNCPYCLKALVSLTRVAKNRDLLLHDEPMKQIVTVIDSQDPVIINYGLQLVANFPLTESLPKKAFLEANGLSSVIKVANQEATSPKNPINKKLSVWILLNLDLDGTLNDTIREYGGISPLVAFLGPDTEEFVRGQAASLLTNMVVNNEPNMEALRNCGAIPALLALSQDKVTEDVQQRAIWCISNMLVSEDNHHPVIEAGGLSIIINKLSSSSNQGILTLCADALANITQFDDFIRMEIGSLGAIPPLLNLISISKTKPMNTDTDLKEHVMRALVNLAHNSDNEEKMLSSGAVPLLVNYLALGVPESFQRYAIMILVNLSLNEKVRIAIRVAGGLSLAAILLCNLNVFEEDSVIQHTLKLLTNLAINGKNRKVMRDTLCLTEFLEKNVDRFKPLQKEYEMIVNNLSFITSSENEEQDDLDEKLFMEFMSKPSQPEPVVEDQMIVQEDEPQPSATPVKSSSNHPRRQKIVDEILSTERSYVQSLTVLVKKFMNPLESNAKSKKPIAPPEKIRHLFSIADVLMNFHSIFLGELSKRVLRWSETQLLGDCFIEMCTGLKMYTDYVNNYNRSIATLQECNKKEAFVDFITKIQMANNVQNLESYLIMPVQRIPRYNMLLQDLSKNTGQDHPDYKNINIALEQMKEVALLINEAERSWSKVKAIQDVIQGNFKAFAGGNRTFIKEGDLILANEPLHVFLMNDLFILTKPLQNPKGNYKYRFSERLDINDIEAKDAGSNAFRLVVFGEKFLTFTTPSTKEKDDWLTSIKKCEAKSRRRSVAFTKN